MKELPNKLRGNPLWRETVTIAEHMYGKVEEIITNYPEEKWATASKLRNSANDSIFYIAQAVGSSTAGANEYDWNNARKNLFALQTMYIFATKQNFLELEPDIVVKIDKLLQKIDIEITACLKAGEKKTQEDLAPWLEKYRLWQAMQDK